MTQPDQHAADHPAPAPGTVPPPYGAPVPLADARRMMAAAEAEAERHGWPMVIAIVNSAAQLVMLHRHDQAQLGSVDIAQEKAMTAVRFRRATKDFQEAIAGGGMGLRMLSVRHLIALEGGLPILRDGAVIGAIGVSGMQSHQDAQVARAALAALEADG